MRTISSHATARTNACDILESGNTTLCKVHAYMARYLIGPESQSCSPTPPCDKDSLIKESKEEEKAKGKTRVS